LLHAVAVSASEFVSASSLDEAMPKALELVSRTLQIDRMTVLERSELIRRRLSCDTFGRVRNRTIGSTRSFSRPGADDTRNRGMAGAVVRRQDRAVHLRETTGDV
jgi:hypothetical protein